MADHIQELIARYPVLSACGQGIRDSYALLEKSFASGGKLLVAGNGGSAADSDHITGELLKAFVKRRRPDKAFLDKLSQIDGEGGAYLADKLEGSLPAVSLCNQTALLTASLNDVDGNVVFAQEVMGLGKPEDVFLGISTSGNSKDIVYAMLVAKAKGLATIALTGRDGGRIAKLADASIIVPEKETFKIQELHLPVYHALCLQIEANFFPE